MLTIDFDSDTEDGQFQTRQARRQNLREKERTRQKFQARKSPRPMRPRRKATQRKVTSKFGINPADHVHHLIPQIVRVAADLEEFITDESLQWFEGRDELINALARDHQLVDKYRSPNSSPTKYEHDVLNTALTFCELDELIEIETKMGWVRLRVIDDCVVMNCTCSTHHMLRAA